MRLENFPESKCSNDFHRMPFIGPLVKYLKSSSSNGMAHTENDGSLIRHSIINGINMCYQINYLFFPFLLA